MAIAARRFFVGGAGEGLVNPEELQNVHDFADDPTNKDRLKFIYEPNIKYGIDGRSFVPQNTDMYGQSGGFDSSNNFLIGSPRQTPYNDITGGGSQSDPCPYGFYRYGGVCLPSAAINPANPNSIFGPDATQNIAKGVLEFIQPPRVTYLNQPFQIAAKIMNVGGKPGKYAIRTTIPALNIAESLSGSVYVNPNQEAWLYQTISFSTTQPTDRVIQAKVDLVQLQQIATGGDISYQLQDTNTVTIPGPLASTLPVGPPQGLPIDNYSRFPGTPGGPRPIVPGTPQPYPFPGQYPTYPGSSALVIVYPSQYQYSAGQQVNIGGANFGPFESVSIKLVGAGSGSGGGISIGAGGISIGGSGGGQTITKSSNTDPYGRINPVVVNLPASTAGYVTITITGTTSRKTASRTINVQPTSSGSGGGIFGGLFG